MPRKDTTSICSGHTSSICSLQQSSTCPDGQPALGPHGPAIISEIHRVPNQSSQDAALVFGDEPREGRGFCLFILGKDSRATLRDAEDTRKNGKPFILFHIYHQSLRLAHEATPQSPDLPSCRCATFYITDGDSHLEHVVLPCHSGSLEQHQPTRVDAPSPFRASLFIFISFLPASAGDPGCPRVSSKRITASSLEIHRQTHSECFVNDIRAPLLPP